LGIVVRDGGKNGGKDLVQHMNQREGNVTWTHELMDDWICTANAPSDARELVPWIENWLRTALGGQFARVKTEPGVGGRRKSFETTSSSVTIDPPDFQNTMSNLRLDMGGYKREEKNAHLDKDAKVLPPLRGARVGGKNVVTPEME